MNKKYSFKEEWANWSKLDRTGFVLYIILSLCFLGGLSYICWFSDIFLNIIKPNGITVILLALGIFQLSKIYYFLVENIFCPETIDERRIKKASRKFHKKYPMKIALLKTKELKYQRELDKIRYQIKND